MYLLMTRAVRGNIRGGVRAMPEIGLHHVHGSDACRAVPKFGTTALTWSR
jgi:hypothetical protein